MRVLFALVAAGGVAGTAAADNGANVEPLTLLENGKIAGCGMMSSSAMVIGEVIAFREGNDTAFAIRARSTPGSSAVTSVRFATASHDSANLFPASAAIGDGIVEAVNEDLIDRPGQLATDPYGAAWMLIARPANADALAGLVTGDAMVDAYTRWLDDNDFAGCFTESE